MNKVQKFVLIGFTIAITPIFLFTLGNNVFAQQFENIKIEKYGIQFEAPLKWSVIEKTSRFEEGPDIEVSSHNSIKIGINYYKDKLSLPGIYVSNIDDALKTIIPILKSPFSDFDVRIIEKPHLTTIGNEMAATGVIAAKERYEDTPLEFANQLWVVINDSQTYVISYLDTPSQFDSQEHTLIREHFINSIQFLGDSATPNSSNTTSRLD